MSLSAELKKKIARVKLKETGTFVSIYAGDLIYDILRVDPRVVDGVDFLRKDDLSSVLKFGKQEIADRAEKSKESLSGLHDSYTGYTFERVVALDFQKKGAEVQFPNSAQQSGHDLVINGEKFQVKTQGDGTDIIERHFEKYPNIRVIANSEAHESFIEKYPEKAHLVINSGFSHVNGHGFPDEGPMMTGSSVGFWRRDGNKIEMKQLVDIDNGDQNLDIITIDMHTKTVLIRPYILETVTLQ